MSISTKLASLALLVCLTAVATAQPSSYYDRYGGWGWGGGGYHHASTAAEGFQRGAADVVRSAGAYNLMTSEAAKNVEEARSANIDNRLKWSQTYFDMRAVNKAARDQERSPRLSSEQLFRIARDRAPDTLSSSDLDPLTGDVSWPIALQDPIFDEYRTKLESLFSDRASKTGGLSLSKHMEVQRTTKAAIDELRKHIRDLPSHDYLAAKNFLEGMAATSGRPAG